MMTAPINVLEHQIVQLPERLDDNKTRLQLYRAAQTEFGPALRLDRKKLTAAGLVGLVSIPKVQIQILPKIYDAHEDAAARGLQFLQATFPLALARRFGLKQAHSAKSGDRLMDVIITFFLQRLEELLEWDFPRSYFEVNEIRDTISGRVDMNCLARQSPGTMRGVLIRHAPLQTDNYTSRLCKAVLDELALGTHGAKVISKSKQLLSSFYDVRTVPLTMELIVKARADDRSPDWEWLFTLANLLVEKKGSNPWEAGNGLGIGVLFRLEHLFEEAVRLALARGMKRTAGSVVVKKGLGHLLHSGSGARFLKLTPDIQIPEMQLVGDIKWKRLSDPEEPVPAEADVYQILVYARMLNVSKCLLIYPSSAHNPNVVRSTILQAFAGTTQLIVIQVDPLQLIQPDFLMRSAAEDIFALAIAAL